jgi:hypothetical protein
MTKIPINKIQKITVSKSDEVALVVEKIIDSEAKEIVLNIPRFSKLSDSLANFHLIKREAKLLDKKIIVESIDDKIIEFADLVGLESLNPILSRSSRRQFSDIVSSKSAKGKEAKETTTPRQSIIFPSKLKRLIWVALALAGFSILIFVLTTVLPRAEVKLVTVKSVWAYNDSVRAEKLSSVDSVNAAIPSQIFSQKETLQLSFPASGKKYVEQKAKGKIIVYNAYSSDPQPLVATTRFITPDGKIFRLSKGITVPAAKIVEGKIIPSTIEAAVVADKAGAEYNVGPVSYFSIPGFKGTPKYQAFYGESKEPMTGGFIGEIAFPTNDDLKKAKSEISASLENSLKEKLLSQMPPEFKILEGALSFNLDNQEVITEIDNSGKFSVSSDATMKIIAFRESDLLAMLEEKIKKDKGDEQELKRYDLEYGVARADFGVGRLSFPIKFSGTLAKRIDAEALREQVRGKSEKSLRALIYGLPDLQSAVISLWPFWVKSVPQNDSKITILID